MAHRRGTMASNINRIAVTLVPTEACLDWINSCPADAPLKVAEIQRDPTVFLIPEGKGEPHDAVRRHYKAMFLEELSSWYTDMTLWPNDLSLTNFKKFFTILTSSMVFDLGSGKIVTEGE